MQGKTEAERVHTGTHNPVQYTVQRCWYIYQNVLNLRKWPFPSVLNLFFISLSPPNLHHSNLSHPVPDQPGEYFFYFFFK